MEQEQRTFDWYRARLGQFNASSIGDLMVKGRGKDEIFGKTAMAVINQVAYERLLNPTIVNDDDMFGEYLEQTDITTRAMRWGIENEPVARSLYMLTAHPTDVVETGSLRHPDLPMLSASPDGLVGDDGLIEIKCVGSANFMPYLTVTDGATLKVAEPRYYWQIQCQLAVTDRQWCDFVVYNPFVRMPIHVARIWRNLADISAMLERVIMANDMANELVDKHQNKQ